MDESDISHVGIMSVIELLKFGRTQSFPTQIDPSLSSLEHLEESQCRGF